MKYVEYAINGYFWVAAFGFPLTMMFLAAAAKDHKGSYRTGYDDGWSEGYDNGVATADLDQTTAPEEKG